MSVGRILNVGVLENTPLAQCCISRKNEMADSKVKQAALAGTPVFLRPYKSPCGDLVLGDAGGTLCLCDWRDSPRREANMRRLLRETRGGCAEGDTALLRRAAAQFDEYFSGSRKHFSLPLCPAGTDFQRNVWQALSLVPYGATASYADIAHALGRTGGVRAVAQAIGANPLSILVPCHRVIGADGSLTGYAGGLAAKRYLLELEKRVAAVVCL